MAILTWVLLLGSHSNMGFVVISATEPMLEMADIEFCRKTLFLVLGYVSNMGSVTGQPF